MIAYRRERNSAPRKWVELEQAEQEGPMASSRVFSVVTFKLR